MAYWANTVLQAVADLSDDIRHSNIISKIVVLTLHFASLRMLWCRSPHCKPLYSYGPYGCFGVGRRTVSHYIVMACTLMAYIVVA